MMPKTKTWMCDVCGAAAEGFWLFPYAAFTVLVPPDCPASPPMFLHFEAGTWKACDACSPSLLANDIDALTKRGYTEYSAEDRSAAALGYLALLRITYTNLVAARLGPPRYATSSEVAIIAGEV